MGPMLADIFMASLENGPLKATIDSFFLDKRHVDDTFVICDNKCDQNVVLQVFNSCHPSIKFTIEAETEETISFLDVRLTKKIDGTLNRSIHRKPTWNGQLTNFYSWVPISRKRNLIISLATRIRKICSPESIEEEIALLRKTLLVNGYPPRFIDKHIKPKTYKEQPISVQKKMVYMNVAFKGDLLADTLKKRISTALKRTFFAATLRLIFSSRQLFFNYSKDKLSHLTTSMCIYQFTCSCGARYIGRSMRVLSKRVQEHYPAWLRKGNNGAIRSAIIEHIVNTGHSICKEKSFKVIYKVKRSLPKSTSFRILCIAEALAIWIEKPDLCTQKKLLHPLLLPWV